MEVREALADLRGVMAGARWQLSNPELCGIAIGAAGLAFEVRRAGMPALPADLHLDLCRLDSRLQLSGLMDAFGAEPLQVPLGSELVN